MRCNQMFVSRQCFVLLFPRSSTLRLSHVAHARCRAANSHPCLQVVDHVCDERNEDEEDEDDEEDDDVALHGCGGVGSIVVMVWLM
jgi:hypothetical protein